MRVQADYSTAQRQVDRPIREHPAGTSSVSAQCDGIRLHIIEATRTQTEYPRSANKNALWSRR